MISRIKEWIDDQARRLTPTYAIVMDDRIYLAVIVLAVVSGVLSGLYG